MAYKKAVINCVILSGIVCLVYACYYNKLFNIYEINDLSVGIHSIQAFSDYPFNVSILGVVVLDILYKIVLINSIAVFSYVTTGLFSYQVSFLVSLIVLIPSILDLIGIKLFSYLSVIKLISFFYYWKASYAVVMFGGVLTLMIIAIMVIVYVLGGNMELILNNLRKTYGTVQALKGISYTFKPGIYGILGANGAGKSTMINLITDNVSRDKKNGGSILYKECDGFEKQGESVQGTDILKLGKSFRAIVGYMPQQQGFYEDFSPRAFLKYMAEIKGIKKINTIDENGNAVIKTVKQQIDELIEIVNLTNVADKKIGGFSGGMKQRVLLAQALLGDPKILILDEPTAGLDPKERINIRNYIAELSKDKIILFATHVVSDIECIADCVLLLKKGEIIAQGTPIELIEAMSGKVGEIKCCIDEVEMLQNKYKIGNIRQRKEGLALRIVGDELPEEAVITDSDIDLEDVYLYYFE